MAIAAAALLLTACASGNAVTGEPAAAPDEAPEVAPLSEVYDECASRFRSGDPADDLDDYMRLLDDRSAIEFQPRDRDPSPVPRIAQDRQHRQERAAIFQANRELIFGCLMDEVGASDALRRQVEGMGGGDLQEAEAGGYGLTWTGPSHQLTLLIEADPG